MNVTFSKYNFQKNVDLVRQKVSGSNLIWNKHTGCPGSQLDKVRDEKHIFDPNYVGFLTTAVFRVNAIFHQKLN